MATLMRRDPFLFEMPTWMERLFDERHWPRMFDLDASTIRVEQFMDDGTLVVRAEMPGLDIDKDVDISVHDGLLHIKAQRTYAEERKDKDYFQSEFRYGAFERTIPLPSGATGDDVKATYENGVIEIRIPTVTPSNAATKVTVQRVG